MTPKIDIVATRNSASDHVNALSASINKELAALNSGGIFTFMHFASDKGALSSVHMCISPMTCFATGLTAILITAACNYFNGVYFYSKLKNICTLMYMANFFAIISGIAFLTGVWSVAMAFKIG